MFKLAFSAIGAGAVTSPV